MLNKIRNLNFGYIVIITSLVAVLSGLKMQSGEVKKTFLCFDAGCIQVQGVSNVLLGLFLLIIGSVMIGKEKWPARSNRWWPLPKKTSIKEDFFIYVRHLFIVEEGNNLTP